MSSTHTHSMAYSIKGAISFGLIYIPVSLTPVIKNNDIGFNLLDKKTNSRVQYQKTCTECDGRVLGKDDIVKGYEYEKGKYVIFTDEDFEKIKSKKDRNITIEQFVDLNEIDPVYFDKAYYVNPSGAEKAYALLVEAMAEQNKAGIAKSVLGSKETLIALRVKDGQLLLNTLFFYDEVQQNPVAKPKVNASEKELAMAKTLIESMSDAFRIEAYHDEYRNKVLQAIEDKVAGKSVVAPKEKAGHKVLDLMKALEMSLSNTQKGKKNGTKVGKTKKVQQKT